MNQLSSRRITPYRLRLLAGALSIALVLAVAWTWSLYGPLASEVTERETSYLTGSARSAALLFGEADSDLQATAERLGEEIGLRVTVVASDGTVIADSEEEPSALENHGDRPEISAALAGRDGTDIRRSDTQDVDRLYVAVPAVVTGERVAVRASTSLAAVNALTGELRTTGLILLAIGTLGALLLAWRVTAVTARPVDRLADAARAMADGDLGTPIPPTNAALAPLGEALAALATQMRDRIQQLQTEQHALRMAVDGLDDAVVLLEDGRVALANRKTGLLLRGSAQTIEGRALAESGLSASLVAAIEDHLLDNAPATVELGPDPYQRYHRLRIVPLGHGPGGRRALIAITDTTDRMRLDAVRADFVANASHELKTPTAGILLLAESADNAAHDGDVEQALAFVSQIRGEAARLRQLVADLLDLSRMERLPGPDAIAEVRRSVDLACSAHRRAASQRDLTLSVDLSAIAGQDIAVAMDAADLAIVLDNLLSNAITYTESGGVCVSVTASDAEVAITVSDTGIGIPEADLERVFERFYRVDRARSRESGGTGLGLSLVRNAVERARGTVAITSHSGEGTTMTVRIPRVR